MSELPTGTVTFLFTDIEGSTTRWEHQPEAMRVALARHDALVRAAIQQHDGHVVKTMGDAFHAAFSRAPDAVAAALDAQRQLQAEPWGEIGPLRVRMALHTGAAEERDGDYYGPPLNRAARLLCAGHGGQILLTQVTAGLVREALSGGVSLRGLGQHRLKDLAEPEHVFQVVLPDLPSRFPALASLNAQPNNLPTCPTDLLGRERELAELGKLFRDGARLVTLTGTGGTGKTRLSLQVAADLLDAYEHGAFFVELAPISDPALVASTIAQSLGLQDAGSRPIVDTLMEHLRGRSILLLLDNFEQILPAASVVAELLAACPSLGVLATSREPLRLRGEQEYAVPPLPLPDNGREPTAGVAWHSPAVSLFVQRARAIRPDFVLTDENAPAVAEICARLDGLPLAIELAAARVRLLAPEAMVRRLERRLPLLVGGARDLPSRQQALRDTIAWSHDLLEEHERRLFRRLSVFVGGWTLDAAEAVCNADGDLDVLAGVESLVAKSLVRQQVQPGGEPRFAMLETIREYALEQLETSGEASASSRRHRDWFLTLAEHAAVELRGPHQAEWFDRLEVEHSNLRAALDWSEAEPDGIGPAASMVEALAWFWVLRSHVREARTRVERLCGQDRGTEEARARLFGVAGYLADRTGELAVGSHWLETGLALWRVVGDRRGLATTLTGLAQAAAAGDDRERASMLLEEAVELVGRTAPGDTRDTVLAAYHETPMSHLARLVELRGDLDRAERLLDEDLAFCRSFGDSHGVANALRGLGSLAFGQGDTTRAAALLNESLDLFRALADTPCIAQNLDLLAHVAALQGRHRRAAVLLGAAETLRGGTGIALRPSVRAVHDLTASTARSGLGGDTFLVAWTEGRAMTLEQAVAHALELPDLT
jgi:predicted ATPase/class 3 adenylate cyclase